LGGSEILPTTLLGGDRARRQSPSWTGLIVSGPMHVSYRLAVDFRIRRLEHVDGCSPLRRIKNDVATVRERQPGAAERAEIVFALALKLVGPRRIYGNPTHSGHPKLRPAVKMTDLALRGLGRNRQAKYMVGRNAAPTADTDEYRVKIAAITCLAVASPNCIPRTGARRLVVIRHRVDEVVVNPPRAANRLTGSEVDLLAKLADPPLDWNHFRLAQIGSHLRTGSYLPRRD